MDGLSTQPAAGIAGALAAHPAASQERLRRQREARRRETAGATDVESEASDAPVEQVNEADGIPTRLPDPPEARPQPHDDQPHIDVTA